MSEVKRVVVTSRRPLRAGEWACVDAKCAHINSEKKTACEICGKSKPRSKNRVGREIGKDAADKSKGLFSADDWVCTKCGNVNWARRTVCNVCNAPKLADVEVRTGYGGGYMDRQDVEYIERKDDDEEFDEFGRKKRRKNKEEKGDDEYPVAQERDIADLDEKVVENEENDDEEESDEGDLGKYDLSADPELVGFVINPAKLAAKFTANNENDNNFDESSDCSCSCSGGECSCEELEPEPTQSKRAKVDEERRRSSERGERESVRAERRDAGDDASHHRSSRSSATSERSRHHDRRSRDRDHHRASRDRDHYR